MIVTCPSCSTRYHVDPEVLGQSGRTVSCARCDHSWMELPPGDRPKQVDEGPSPEQLQSLLGGAQQPAKAERRRIGRSLVWAGLFVLLLLVAGGAVVERQRITALWPPAAELYEMAGLEVAPSSEGLALRNVHSASERSDGGIVIVIKGEVFNASGRARLVPALRAELRNANEQVLRSWTIAPAKERLAPGESTPFTDRFANPPSGAVDLMMTFDVRS